MSTGRHPRIVFNRHLVNMGQVQENLLIRRKPTDLQSSTVAPGWPARPLAREGSSLDAPKRKRRSPAAMVGWVVVVGR